MKVLPVVIAGVLLAGCATTQAPVLYPNAKFKQVGDAAAQRDVDECMALADKAGASSSASGSGAARGGLQGAAMGGAAAAVGSIIRGGNIVNDTAAGAAVGGAAGAAGGAFSNSGNSVHQNFVARCLAERGYEVIGWK